MHKITKKYSGHDVTLTLSLRRDFYCRGRVGCTQKCRPTGCFIVRLQVLKALGSLPQTFFRLIVWKGHILVHFMQNACITAGFKVKTHKQRKYVFAWYCSARCELAPPVYPLTTAPLCIPHYYTRTPVYLPTTAAPMYPLTTTTPLYP